MKRIEKKHRSFDFAAENLPAASYVGANEWRIQQLDRLGPVTKVLSLWSSVRASSTAFRNISQAHSHLAQSMLVVPVFIDLLIRLS